MASWLVDGVDRYQGFRVRDDGINCPRQAESGVEQRYNFLCSPQYQCSSLGDLNPNQIDISAGGTYTAPERFRHPQLNPSPTHNPMVSPVAGYHDRVSLVAFGQTNQRLVVHSMPRYNAANCVHSDVVVTWR